jgi:hypothetical protein
MGTISTASNFDHDPLATDKQASRTSSSFDGPEQPSEDPEVDFLAGDDDSRWDVFLPDDDEIDPLPEPGDFWLDDD